MSLPAKETWEAVFYGGGGEAVLKSIIGYFHIYTMPEMAVCKHGKCFHKQVSLKCKLDTILPCAYRCHVNKL